MKTIAKAVSKAIPPISETEKAALEAGNIGLETMLFEGEINWQRLQNLKKPEISKDVAILKDKIAKECGSISDWDIAQKGCVTPSVVPWMAKLGLFGMMIKKEYGGLELNAFERAVIVAELSAHSPSLGILAMVPNSLGPAELLQNYGTDEQKLKYLPRLATGEIIPCFGLTSPWAGSDAAAIPDFAILKKDESGSLYAELTAKKRYITLAPIADIIGIAFRMLDPENLMGKGTDLGICLGLIEKGREGLQTGEAHLPLDALFPNGVLNLDKVKLNLDHDLIGGKEAIGKGWGQLMQCLAEGRAISLPSSCFGAALGVAKYGADYSQCRQAFGFKIAEMQGPASRMAEGNAQLLKMWAIRDFSAAHVLEYHKPTIVGAFAKRKTTELARKGLSLSMDVLGGKAICMGPENPLARHWMSAPISITVEGANSLTRDLILFNQGIIRAHPHLFSMMSTAQEAANGNKEAMGKFRKAFLGLAKGYLKGFSAMARIEHCYKRDANLDKDQAYFKKLLRNMNALALFFSLGANLALTQGKALRVNQIQSGRLADAMEGLLTMMALVWRVSDYIAKDEPELLAVAKIAFDEEYRLAQGALKKFFTNLSGFSWVGAHRILSKERSFMNVSPKEQLIASTWINEANQSWKDVSVDIEELKAHSVALKEMANNRLAVEQAEKQLKQVGSATRKNKVLAYWSSLPPAEAAGVWATQLDWSLDDSIRYQKALEGINKAVQVDTFKGIDAFERQELVPTPLNLELPFSKEMKEWKSV